VFPKSLPRPTPIEPMRCRKKLCDALSVRRYVKFCKVARKPLWHNDFLAICPAEGLPVKPRGDDAFGKDAGFSGT
jgi:hypothetical protein